MKSSRMSQSGFTAMLGMIAIICSIVALACLTCSPAVAQDRVSANAADPIAAEMQRHNQEIARLLQREPFRFTAAENPAPATAVPVGPDQYGNYPIQGGYGPASPGVPVLAGTTCDCARTGVCTCNPATCVCAACRNGQVRMMTAGGPAVRYSTATPWVTTSVATVPAVPLTSVTQQFATSTGFFGNRVGVGTVTSSNVVDRKGRQRIYYSGVNKRTARAMAAGVQ